MSATRSDQQELLDFVEGMRVGIITGLYMVNTNEWRGEWRDMKAGNSGAYYRLEGHDPLEVVKRVNEQCRNLVKSKVTSALTLMWR